MAGRQTMPDNKQKQKQQLVSQPVRDTCGSCEFCAKRRVRCDGLLPRCSYCTKMNQDHCDYRKKQPVKSKRKTTAAPRRRGSGANKRPVEPHQLASGGGMVVTPVGRSARDLPRAFSLKRCRLSASPATGLVGMQENAFLNDYFACLGFLPLASPCVIRQAMVKIMLSSMPQQYQETVRVGQISGDGREHARLQQKGDDVGWGQTLAYQEATSYAAECILWCTIALGALVQGCSSTFVAGYLKKARDSLAECFDGTNVETARAYLVMAFLHSFLGDQENNQKYLAFANSIVERLPQDVIPSGMEHMLLAEGDESRLFHYGCRGSGIGVKLKEKSAYSNQIPSAKEILHEKDLCTFFFLADRYWHKAFLEDMRRGSNTTERREGAHGRGMEREPSQFNEQSECEKLKGLRGLAGNGHGVPPPSGVVVNSPPAGSAMRTCIKVILPELTSLLAMIERSGSCSGVGSFVLNGGMAYMQAVKGDMRSSFKSLRVCAKVLVQFPGICRYRPHLVHCVMAAAASSVCRKVYDPVRDIYNSILPWNGTPAPPMEEWGGMSCICDHVFCRSLGTGTTKMNSTPSKLISARERAAAAAVHMPHSSGLRTASVTEATRQPLDCRAFRATPAAALMGVGGTDGAAPCFTNGATLSSPTLAETLSKLT